MLLVTPTEIRTLQRKLCVKAKSKGYGACLDMKNIGKPCAGKPQARFDEDCALQAHEVQRSEMTAPAKPSQQPGTESCVVFGNDHCEA
jgi:hypothetical protein